MPAVSERQRSFMGAELSRKRSGKKTRTGMSESQLEDFSKQPKAGGRWAGDEERTAGDAKQRARIRQLGLKGTSSPSGSKELNSMGKSLIKAITKYLRKQEDDFPPTKGERREAKRTKAKRMGMSGAGVKNTQQIIGRKGKGFGKQSVSEATAADPEASKRSLNRQRVAATQSRSMPDPSTSSPTVAPGQERHSRPLPLAEEASHSPMGTRTRGYVAASDEGPAEYTPNGSIPKKASSRLKSTTARSPVMIQPSPNGKAEGIVTKAIDTYLKAEEYPPVDPKVIREGMKKIREARQGRRAKRNGHQPNSPTPSA